MKIIPLLMLLLYQLYLSSKLFLKSSSSQVMTNANNVNSPMIPVAAGIGGEVIIACTECQKMMTKFIMTCVDQEANGATSTTFRAFCEANRGQNLFNVNPDLCLVLNEKLASVAGESGAEMIDPTKAPALCVKFKNECDKLGGPPKCFSGFCENIAECVDCPAAVIDKEKKGSFELEVCGLGGVCKLGWKSPVARGGNGYCECRQGMRGLACNEY